MPVKKRYDVLKSWKEFDALEKPEYLSRPEFMRPLSDNLNDMQKIVYDLQGKHWGANNQNKGSKIANAGINLIKHSESIIRARKLLIPFQDRLCNPGIVSIISRTTDTPKSTVRRYINLIKENAQDQ